MNNEQRVEAFIALHSHLETLVGRQLIITEYITDREFDRHGTTMTFFKFTLKDIAWRMSGGRLMMNGINEELYEISPQLIESRIESQEVEVVEILGTNPTGKPLKRMTKIEIK